LIRVLEQIKKGTNLKFKIVPWGGVHRYFFELF